VGLGALLACLLAGAATAEERFRSDPGRFRVLFPEAPSHRTSARRTMLGRVLDGHPGRRIRYTHPDDAKWPRVALVVLAGHRLYFVVVADSPASRAVLAPERFLASFELWSLGGW
jgi:hypothetical protein